jgi:hypothetical protein
MPPKVFDSSDDKSRCGCILKKESDLFPFAGHMGKSAESFRSKATMLGHEDFKDDRLQVVHGLPTRVGCGISLKDHHGVGILFAWITPATLCKGIAVTIALTVTKTKGIPTAIAVYIIKLTACVV